MKGSFVVLAVLAASPALAAGGKSVYRCELRKDGHAAVDEAVKSRKECKKKGGKWVKDAGAADAAEDADDATDAKDAEAG